MNRFESIQAQLGGWGLECSRSDRGFVVVNPATDDWISISDIGSLEYFMDGLQWGRQLVSEEG